ncbi:hypothetical protein J2Z69_001872 [Paenibacillus shirakamiensis]|uniref:Adenine/guanine phosphoribosyltransferase n=1 Tax=Paenibacillus shirakamiensis TaxID=1265935 RepID=A0ABS4JGJ2_9BACL|nr:phosphoribosyltransferase family protein [Paenibacillus shirakamiensis]MBP2000841.1 hypothetical protein [Paenibacillus shirakamiensis]
MNIKTSLPFSSDKMNLPKEKHLYNILEDLEVTIEVTRNPFQLPLDLLFEMAARINKKRSFLFVSKVLGKHLPVNPHVSLLSGAALGILYQQQCGGRSEHRIEDIIEGFYQEDKAEEIYRNLKSRPLAVKEPTLFIGFAETATALGHSMFDIFSGPTKYVHTTRDCIAEVEPVLQFEEEHSHATAHRCYAQSDFFTGDEPVVLIDDEITTGRTALNIIQDLHQKYPRNQYVIASLLDWRSDQDILRFHEVEQQLGITISTLSLIQGSISVSGSPIEAGAPANEGTLKESKAQIYNHPVGHFFEHYRYSSLHSADQVNTLPYLKSTGRFGMTGADISGLDQQVDACASYLEQKRMGSRTLCLGTGEFMYIPMRIAAQMGQGISYQSTTRSPIHPSPEDTYAIHHVYPFDCPEDGSIPNFFYNITGDLYDEIFVFMEREKDRLRLTPLLQALESTKVNRIHIVDLAT